MNDKKGVGVHWSFWVIGVVALVWNGMGVINYFMQMNADSLTSFPETHRAIIQGRPAWATGGFAIAVFGGALGCVLLLLRKSVAFAVFIASFVGVIVTMAHAFGLGIDFGIGEIAGIILMPLAVAVFLIWHSKHVEKKGWNR